MLYFHTRKFIFDFAGLWVYNCQHGADDRVGSQGKKKIKIFFANAQKLVYNIFTGPADSGNLSLLGN
jgi:hypothetical protein